MEAVATAIAYGMGGVVLGSFSKRVFDFAAFFFAVGAAIELALLVFW